MRGNLAPVLLISVHPPETFLVVFVKTPSCFSFYPTSFLIRRLRCAPNSWLSFCVFFQYTPFPTLFVSGRIHNPSCYSATATCFSSCWCLGSSKYLFSLIFNIVLFNAGVWFLVFLNAFPFGRHLGPTFLEVFLHTLSPLCVLLSFSLSIPSKGTTFFPVLFFLWPFQPFCFLTALWTLLLLPFSR